MHQTGSVCFKLSALGQFPDAWHAIILPSLHVLITMGEGRGCNPSMGHYVAERISHTLFVQTEITWWTRAEITQ